MTNHKNSSYGRDSSGKAAGNVIQANVPAFPSQTLLEGTSVAGTADDDVLYTSPDVSAFNVHYFQNTAAEGADVHVSFDGVTFVGPQDLEIVTTAADLAAGEVGRLVGKYKYIRVDQDGAGTPSAGEILVFHGVQ